MLNLKGKKIIVGMSGGVDSSVAALILKNQGADVEGLHMKGANVLTADDDIQMVKSVCDKIGIKCNIVDYSDEMQFVKDYFFNEYAAGKTPNPCVVCNKYVKFKPFIEFVQKSGADYFATGHYAIVDHTDGKHILRKGLDENKDQSYFLNQLSQSQLEKAVFPLGNLTKPEVRKIAEENGLISAHKKDSFDVCFIGSQKFKDFISQKCPQKEGDIVDILSGNIVGRHNGIMKYTIGQRKGLGIGGGHGETGEGWFVTGKNIKKNIVYVSQGDGEKLLSDALISRSFNFIPEFPQINEFDCLAKFRYRQKDQNVKVTINPDKSVNIIFKEKQRAVTTGQFVVLYKKSDDGKTDICLGGGTIDQVLKNGKILDL